MLDISILYNRYKFLGYEFLTWLWFSVENQPDKLRLAENSTGTLALGHKILLENQDNNRLESVSIKGENADFNEGLLALSKGAWVMELHLIFEDGGNKWQFALKGENINFLNIKTPEIGSIETAEDTEGFILEKTFLYNKLFEYMDGLFHQFIRLRLSEQWTSSVVPEIRKWIRS
ncbi:MAG: hypothetical protein KKF30_12075 [Proteobacteria bacterium]|nr:hypothetical protein [Pseudomonadota bacterium]MBU4469418.1 hypothetical protein [Pseudomonadota bacterium]MCG2752318.1 hypothetical protein [Desulfobacteraceae bacterium]